MIAQDLISTVAVALLVLAALTAIVILRRGDFGRFFGVLIIAGILLGILSISGNF